MKLEPSVKLWIAALRGYDSVVKKIIAGLDAEQIDEIMRTLGTLEEELSDAREWLVKPYRAKLRRWNRGLRGYNTPED